MKYVLAAFLIASFSAHAVFQQIWKGYKTSSVELIRDLETAAVKNALDVSLSENAWRFDLSGSAEDSHPDALFSFNAQRTITNSYGLKLTRQTFNYGSFTLEHTQTRVDISNWTDTFFTTTAVDQLYEARNTLTYSYDIIGRSMPLREESAQARHSFESAQNSLEREQEYIDFYRAYLAAKLQVYRSRLAEEFRSRATRLKNVIYKRYKDGLSREAEYLQAKNSELAQKREVDKAASALKEAVAVIENILGRQIPKEYFAMLSWDFKSFAQWSKQIPNNDNKSLKAMEERIKLVMVDLERFENDRGHRLSFNASYSANAFSEDIDDSIYQGDFISPANDVKQVSLVYSIPLGMDYDRAEREKLFIDRKRTQLQKNQLVDELELREKVLSTQIKRYESAFSHASEQVEVAARRVKLQSRLYLRGLGTFDENIRAEQELLDAKSSLYQILYEYDSILGSYAFLNGSVESLLNSYTD